MPLESAFKIKLIKQIERDFPGAIVLKNDANRHRGILDHLVLYGPRWAMFEAKAFEGASHRPSQDYYVDLFNKMSYASFVYPENREEFLYELQKTFRSGG